MRCKTNTLCKHLTAAIPMVVMPSACELVDAASDSKIELGDEPIGPEEHLSRTFGPADGGGLDVSGPGDIDGDGYADLVASFATADGTTSVCFFFGSAGGMPELEPDEAGACLLVDHEPGLSITEGIGMWPVRPIGLDDVDADGVADLGIWAARRNEDTRLHVFLGGAALRDVASLEDASGSLSLELGSDYQAWPVATTELDGDGRSDLVIERWYSSPSSAGGPVAAKSLWSIPGSDLAASGSTEYGLPAQLGDFETDGLEIEVAVGQSASGGELVVATNSLQNSGELTWEYRRLSSEPEQASLVGGRRLRSFVLSDLDCDGVDELVGVESDDDRLWSYTVGSDEAQARFEFATLDPSAVYAAGDLDADGCSDLAILGFVGGHPEPLRSRIRILYGGDPVEAGDVLELPRDPRVWGYRPVSPAGDLDGDGFGELFIETDGDFSAGRDDPSEPIERVLLLYGGPRPGGEAGG